jgi:hypothetical protein
MDIILHSIQALSDEPNCIYFDPEGTLSSSVRAIGNGGAKRCFVTTNDE